MNAPTAAAADPASAGGERVWAIVVAGGSGNRFGRPKQFLNLGGSTVVARSIAAARSVAAGVVVVVPAGQSPAGDAPDPDFGADIRVDGGPSRAASVRAGLAAVPDDATVVVIHDAARPLAAPALFQAVVAAVTGRSGVEGCIPVLPVTDTLKRVAGTEVLSTVDRSDLVAAQTPQAFRAAVLRRAHREGADATDDAALLESMGATVRTVPGDPRNLKLTVPQDLVLAEILVGS
ncbi:MAG TPA: 2-C-methyl-D-erythritol 4-phosphate cytidylyltransferase [Acidimicrobiales bacterium]|nr:2-C-methyl-D-erythritol 4-phosphate cytidylyltransferase [Acidimicrobiales bacterium]